MRNPKNLRTCAGCGKKADKSDLIRIGKSSDGTIDVGKGGRGAYICKGERCFNAALKKKRISHILRAPVPQEVYDKLSKELGCD